MAEKKTPQLFRYSSKKEGRELIEALSSDHYVDKNIGKSLQRKGAIGVTATGVVISIPKARIENYKVCGYVESQRSKTEKQGKSS